jgi:4-amino-4-deoxy-L-arabinose transferase-like glycosyltransferase
MTPTPPTPRIDRTQAVLLGAAIALGIAVRVAYELATRHVPLAGDAPEYDAEGMLIAHGHWFWTRLPYGILHAGAWKAPGYPLWVGLWYALVGHHVLVVRLAQAVLGGATIALSWVLARRLFSPRVATVAAFVVAVYPLAWQYDGLLYPESLATPLTVAILIAILPDRATAPHGPSMRRAALAGGLLGISLLIRPSGEFLLLGALVAWITVAGARRGIALTAVAAGVAIAVVVPWTVRNAVVMHGFVPISMQDAALYGTFNAQSAHDPHFPYAWRADPPDVAALFDPRHPLSDPVLRSRLISRAEDYISAHPVSLLEAFWWNGIRRLWDLRSRAQSLVEVSYEGRSRFVSEAGLDAYDILLPLALLGLWRGRRGRRAIVLAVLAIALGASVVFAVEGGTRYRAPLEPLIAVLACVGVLGPA